MAIVGDAGRVIAALLGRIFRRKAADVAEARRLLHGRCAVEFTTGAIGILADLADENVLGGADAEFAVPDILAELGHIESGQVGIAGTTKARRAARQLIGVIGGVDVRNDSLKRF